MAISASLFFVLMWVLVLALTPKPFSLSENYGYIGIYGVSSPLLPLCTSAEPTTSVFHRDLVLKGLAV